MQVSGCSLVNMMFGNVFLAPTAPTTLSGAHHEQHRVSCMKKHYGFTWRSQQKLKQVLYLRGQAASGLSLSLTYSATDEWAANMPICSILCSDCLDLSRIKITGRRAP